MERAAEMEVRYLVTSPIVPTALATIPSLIDTAPASMIEIVEYRLVQKIIREFNRDKYLA